MAVDSLISLLLLSAILLLFAASVFHKLTAVQHFFAVVADYQLAPDALSRPLGFALIISELSVLILALSGRVQWALVLAVVLLAIYSIGISMNLVRGRRDIDCGCAGPAATQTLSEWLVVRNATLLLVALAALIPANNRALTFPDWVTLAAGLGAMCGLYTAANTLIANHLQLTSDRENRLWKTR